MNRARTDTTRAIGIVLLCLAAASTVAAALIAVTGGFTFNVAGVRVSMHAVIRPMVAAMAFFALSCGALGRDESMQRLSGIAEAIVRRAGWVVLAYAIAIAFAAYSTGAHLAGGTDSSGYLSQARLWRAGALHIETPLAADLRFENRQYAFTPTGFQPSVIGQAVPAYPPGFPLMLAAAGERAQFLVVPFCAGAIVMMAFAIGRKLGGLNTALIAAAAAGASPILLFQAAQPMSDVPATFWWTLAIWLLLVDSWIAPIAAGVAAACGCLVRPNMFAIAPLLGVLTIWWNGSSRASIARALQFAAPVAIAAIAFIYLQQTLFGDPTKTGYGSMDSLFGLENVWLNLQRYPKWTIFVQSGLIVSSVAAPFALHAGWILPEIDRTRAVRVAWSALVLFAALQGLYLLYLVFNDWVYFRFLLPALPLVLVLQAAVLVSVAQRAPLPARDLAVVVLAVLVASWGVGRARGLGAFRLQDSEQRYLDVAEYTRGLPPDAVFVTLQYAGSLWYYRAAPVLRWDWIDAIEIDAAIDQLTSRRRRVYAVVDSFELPQLRERYAGTRFVTRLNSPMFEAGEPSGIKGRIYDVTGTTADAGGR